MDMRTGMPDDTFVRRHSLANKTIGTGLPAAQLQTSAFTGRDK
jgi:hypothetical protein